MLISLATTALTSAIDGATQRNIRGKGIVRAEKGINLVISNEDINGIIKIIKSLKNSSVLIDGFYETVKQGRGFLCMLLGTLGASILGNMTPRKGVSF